jgi:hypothetical protein
LARVATSRKVRPPRKIAVVRRRAASSRPWYPAGTCGVVRHPARRVLGRHRRQPGGGGCVSEGMLGPEPWRRHPGRNDHFTKRCRPPGHRPARHDAVRAADPRGPGCGDRTGINLLCVLEAGHAQGSSPSQSDLGTAPVSPARDPQLVRQARRTHPQGQQRWITAGQPQPPPPGQANNSIVGSQFARHVDLV